MKYAVDEETLKEICSEIEEVKNSSINFPMKEMHAAWALLEEFFLKAPQPRKRSSQAGTLRPR